MNREDVLQLLRTRYTTKHYDASRPVSDEDLAVLLEALRLSPTSVNGQYTKFFVAKTPEARARLMPAVMDFNQERVKNAIENMTGLTVTDVNIDVAIPIVKVTAKPLTGPVPK